MFLFLLRSLCAKCTTYIISNPHNSILQKRTLKPRAVSKLSKLLTSVLGEGSVRGATGGHCSHAPGIAPVEPSRHHAKARAPFPLPAQGPSQIPLSPWAQKEPFWLLWPLAALELGEMVGPRKSLRGRGPARGWMLPQRVLAVEDTVVTAGQWSQQWLLFLILTCLPVCSKFSTQPVYSLNGLGGRCEGSVFFAF